MDQATKETQGTPTETRRSPAQHERFTQSEVILAALLGLRVQINDVECYYNKNELTFFHTTGQPNSVDEALILLFKKSARIGLIPAVKKTRFLDRNFALMKRKENEEILPDAIHLLKNLLAKLENL